MIGGIISVAVLCIACFAFALVVLNRWLGKSRYEAKQNQVLPEPTEQSPCNMTGEQALKAQIPVIKTGQQDLETGPKQQIDVTGASLASNEYDVKPTDLELSRHQQVASACTYPEVPVNAPHRGPQQCTVRLPPVHSAIPGSSAHSSTAGNPAAEIKVEGGHIAVKTRWLPERNASKSPNHNKLRNKQ